MDAQQLTRQIYWSPSGGLNHFLHQSTYIWLVIATVICVYGISRHVTLWRKGKKEICFDKPLVRIGFFLKNVLLWVENIIYFFYLLVKSFSYYFNCYTFSVCLTQKLMGSWWGKKYYFFRFSKQVEEKIFLISWFYISWSCCTKLIGCKICETLFNF